MPDSKNRQTETELKGQIKDYLTIKGIFNWPILQGMGAYPGLPDRVMHFEGHVHYLEIKKLTGRLSDYQFAFQARCLHDGISYHVIHSLDEMIEVVG